MTDLRCRLIRRPPTAPRHVPRHVLTIGGKAFTEGAGQVQPFDDAALDRVRDIVRRSYIRDVPGIEAGDVVTLGRDEAARPGDVPLKPYLRVETLDGVAVDL